MIKLHHEGVLREFADAPAIVAHFDLTAITKDDLAGMKAASDAGFPLHAEIDPLPAELRGVRVLLLEVTSRELKAEVRQRYRDI